MLLVASNGTVGFTIRGRQCPCARFRGACSTVDRHGTRGRVRSPEPPTGSPDGRPGCPRRTSGPATVRRCRARPAKRRRGRPGRHTASAGGRRRPGNATAARGARPLGRGRRPGTRGDGLDRWPLRGQDRPVRPRPHPRATHRHRRGRCRRPDRPHTPRPRRARTRAAGPRPGPGRNFSAAVHAGRPAGNPGRASARTRSPRHACDHVPRPHLVSTWRNAAPGCEGGGIRRRSVRPRCCRGWRCVRAHPVRLLDERLRGGAVDVRDGR